MTLSKKQVSSLIQIIESVQAVLKEAMSAPTSPKAVGTNGTKRTRRVGADLIAFKKAIKKERRAGASVSELSQKYGVTPSYIYTLND